MSENLLIVSTLSTKYEKLAEHIEAMLGDQVSRLPSSCGELTYQVEPDALVEVSQRLRDEPGLEFDTLIDVSGVDYMGYGQDEWNTVSATGTGFSRGVGSATGGGEPGASYEPPGRFAAAYHLLSVANNRRVRLKAFCSDDERPILPSVIGVWPSANWYEREVFDLFGILFQGHPDLRRLLTDYGFIGHPFRKDFPLVGHVEVRYDPSKGRVVYEPVSIEPRTLVPRVIRDDNRYEADLKGSQDG